MSAVIHISAVRHGDLREFAVGDNGIGIEHEYFDQIFELFSRLKTTDEQEGTRIGLVIVRKIIERHGGEYGSSSRQTGDPRSASPFQEKSLRGVRQMNDIPSFQGSVVR
ncbi:ATP-binding protein [Methanosphaerula palustris]|uniref:ATP-binding protein n=1 Tax=Methanosphaerula palustris TaxID=475088 RepID=UPI000184844F|nr:ATP-binding protein [Methanosphaerula palustris]